MNTMIFVKRILLFSLIGIFAVRKKGAGSDPPLRDY
jgi:hypothetical protein